MDQNNTPPYLDTLRPFAERADDLVARMTRDEKVQQMLHEASAIERLKVPRYNWWNEGLHGVARAGIATVFPQAIGMASTWNTDLIHEVATIISKEARAKHHDAVRSGRVGEHYYGLTLWSPNINIFRDPRWGRGQETYGEDPYLTARLAVNFIRGLQGDDPRYLRTAACAKHYAVHSGPEADRHHFNAEVNHKDLWETYLPAFEAAVREARVESVMGAYNRTNGEPCCASFTLLEDILRQRWNFDGHVVSDCWAIIDIYEHHRVTATPEEAAALAVKAGCDLNCGVTYGALVNALEQGLIDEETIDRSVKRLMMTRMRLGMFDPPEMVAYAQIPIEVNDCAEHQALALRTARESMVLLKNADGFLPLDKSIGTIAVIGPNADNVDVLLGNYNGTPSQPVTLLQGIKDKVGPQTQVLYARGCGIMGHDTSGYAEAVAVAEQADVVVFVGGLSQVLEGEEGQHESVPDGETSQGDRTKIELLPVQENLLRQLHATGRPVVLVLVNGSAIAVNWADANLPAILEAWYPGQAGGTAVADVLFGDYNPAGRLPVTFYRSTDDLPDFSDYSMEKRTYRYFRGEPLYPFGHGLSYTTFAYDNLRLSATHIEAGEPVEVRVDVTNTGDRAGDEVVQLYLADVVASTRVPQRSLAGFARLALEPGQTVTATFTITPQQYAMIDAAGRRVIEPGAFDVFVGGGQPGFASGQGRRFEVTGEGYEL